MMASPLNLAKNQTGRRGEKRTNIKNESKNTRADQMCNEKKNKENRKLNQYVFFVFFCFSGNQG